MKAARVLSAALAVTLAVFFAPAASPSFAQEEATVTKVMDGDTIGVTYDGGRESVRLIGIDAPESAQNDKARRDAKRSAVSIATIMRLGGLSTKYMKTLVRQGDVVGIEFDEQKRDKFGRLLCYVYLADGRMLNEVMVADGYAFPYTVPPNVKHADDFLKANEAAIDARAGLYADGLER